MFDQIGSFFYRANKGGILDVVSSVRDAAIDEFKAALSFNRCFSQAVAWTQSFNRDWHLPSLRLVLAIWSFPPIYRH